MAQANYPALCHSNSVLQRQPGQTLIPWQHFSAKDYAQYLYKWYKTARIHRGEKNEWGNWGTTLLGAGGICILLEVNGEYLLVQGAQFIGNVQLRHSISK